MLKKCIELLIKGDELTSEQCQIAMQNVLSAENIPQISAFMTLLRAKQETAEEALGIANAMRANMLEVPVKEPVLDIVGTGGDGAGTVNISTGASILAASCGVKVAKHGNRSVSSLCGSADVLDALGVNINLTPNDVAACIEEVGIGFCFAPLFHPALKNIKDIRTQLAIPTIFNIMGPLLNPAKAEYAMIGVFKEELMGLMADVLIKLKVKRAMVFHSAGLDELHCGSTAKVIDITVSEKQEYILDPAKFGFNQCHLGDLQGGTAKENAALLNAVFEGEEGAIADTLILNAAVALYLYGKSESIEEAVSLVRDAIKQGKSKKLLEHFVKFTQSKN